MLLTAQFFSSGWPLAAQCQDSLVIALLLIISSGLYKLGRPVNRVLVVLLEEDVYIKSSRFKSKRQGLRASILNIYLRLS